MFCEDEAPVFFPVSREFRRRGFWHLSASPGGTFQNRRSRADFQRLRIARTDLLHHRDGVLVWGQYFTQAQQGAQGGTTKAVTSGTTQTATSQSGLVSYTVISLFPTPDAWLPAKASARS